MHLADHERDIDQSANIRYANAPIREAILRVQVELIPAIDVVFKRVAHAVGDRYCVVDEDTAAHSVLAKDPDESHVLYLQSSDERHIVRLRSDGFMFSQIGNYSSWDPFVGEARRIWEIFRDCVGPVRIQS